MTAVIPICALDKKIKIKKKKRKERKEKRQIDCRDGTISKGQTFNGQYFN